jgi:hypothetical protein
VEGIRALLLGPTVIRWLRTAGRDPYAIVALFKRDVGHDLVDRSTAGIAQ